MTNPEIKKAIDERYALIEEKVSVEQFVLNKEVEKLASEITELQHECTHKFVDGYCVYCYKAEEDK